MSPNAGTYCLLLVTLLSFVLSLDVFDTNLAHIKVYKCDTVNDILRLVSQLSPSKPRYDHYVTVFSEKPLEEAKLYACWKNMAYY